PSPSEVISGFLDLAHWPMMDGQPPVVKSASPDSILIEQSFSDFGDADVLILASTPHEKVAFFCEAKRGKSWRLQTEWDQFKARFQNSLAGGVSNVFRQLYFKQRLAQALAAGEDLDTGIEFDGVLSPVRGIRRRKIGRNRVVLKAVDVSRWGIASLQDIVPRCKGWHLD